MIIAWRVFFMTTYPRLHPNHPCTVGLSSYEWQALYSIVNQTHTIPDQPPTIREMVRMIASKGGFLACKSDGEPGPMTIWKGLVTLSAIVESYLVTPQVPCKG